MRRTRADDGLRAIRAGTPDRALNDDQTNLVDTLANIMHACRRYGLDFDRALESATGHFEAEVAEPSGRVR